jgi:enoyl-[acyl-carrier protein] reductase/trans-2-enoyl-CoA reductase (NAD+)
MIVSPKVRGFICTTSHPEGCKTNVINQIAYTKSRGSFQGPKKVLIIGSSTGYGLASRIVAGFGANAQTLGVFFEKEANGKRTASAGWYNSSAYEIEANKSGLYAKSINIDAFSDEAKQKVIEIIKNDWQGNVDLIVYSLAAPRRQHPKTNQTFNSTLKPIDKHYSNKTIDIMTGEISNVEIESATEQEISDTVAVMGGEDWQFWIDALLAENLLAKGCKTIAYSYIGPELTYPIYRNGTIGKAKEHLEETANDLNRKLSSIQGNAYISVNKGLVTQSSSAIPIVPLYISILYKVMKNHNVHEGCIEQIYRLFSLIYIEQDLQLDSLGRIRIDNFEMRDDVQEEIEDIWNKISTENAVELADLQGYRNDFYGLFGFNLPDLNYSKEVEINVQIPSLENSSIVA